MKVVNMVEELFGTGLVWLFIGLVLVIVVPWGAGALADEIKHRREQRRYDAEAYEQLRIRQEFKRIVAEEEEG